MGFHKNGGTRKIYGWLIAGKFPSRNGWWLGTICFCLKVDITRYTRCIKKITGFTWHVPLQILRIFGGHPAWDLPPLRCFNGWVKTHPSPSARIINEPTAAALAYGARGDVGDQFKDPLGGSNLTTRGGNVFVFFGGYEVWSLLSTISCVFSTPPKKTMG